MRRADGRPASAQLLPGHRTVFVEEPAGRPIGAGRGQAHQDRGPLCDREEPCVVVAVGVDVAGCDGVDEDAVLAQLVGVLLCRRRQQ